MDAPRRWMVPIALGAVAAVAVVSLALIARDDDSPTAERTAGEASGKDYEPAIDPARFTNKVDNPFFPLRPGTRWVYENTGQQPERIVVTVTDQTREVMGVDTVVVHDTVSRGGKLFEDTYDWYAQDDEGNVWYFGEETKELEDGEVSTEGSWEAGVDGAQPGIIMQADPEVGDRYRQEFYEGEAEDMGEVLALDEHVQVPYGSFDGVLKTRDWNPLEPGPGEHKYYARGVGVVLEASIEGRAERVELVRVTH
jgi:hypothetical protein